VTYQIQWLPAAARQLRKLDKPVQKRLVLAVARLGTDPRPHGVKALIGRPGALRLRAGDWRVVYEVNHGRLVVLVVVIGHRREVYGR
jgi:mRNA interferase RelE/StbE